VDDVECSYYIHDDTMPNLFFSVPSSIVVMLQGLSHLSILHDFLCSLNILHAGCLESTQPEEEAEDITLTDAMRGYGLLITDLTHEDTMNIAIIHRLDHLFHCGILRDEDWLGRRLLGKVLSADGFEFFDRSP